MLDTRHRSRGDYGVDGLGAGLFAGVPMLVVIVFFGLLNKLSLIDIAGVFSLSGSSNVFSGIVSHFAVASIYGAIFGFIASFFHRANRKSLIFGGVVYSIFLYAFAVVFIIPGETRNVLSNFTIVFMLAHLIYGATLGLVMSRRSLA